MENAASKAPETSTMELTLMVEDELARLQRQYRIMESDRTAYLDHIKGSAGKQCTIIANLKTEQSMLLQNLHVADSKHNRRKDEQIIVRLKRLLDEHGSMSDKIRLRKTYVSELNFQIRKINRDILGIRFEMRKVEKSREERVALVQKNLFKLENKLETYTNRYGIILSQNRRLRQNIDHLLNERQQFNKNWELLFLRLESSKRFMLDLIEQATLAYDQREEWCQKLEALKMRAFSDLQYHSEEMRELQRNLDHDVALQNFLLIKGQRRIANSLLKKEVMKREELKMQLREQTAKYSKTLNEIQEFAGNESVDQLASRFIKQEEENFALFNYIHELNSELECIADSIHTVQLKINEQREINSLRNIQRMDNIRCLNKYLDEITAKTQKADNECVGMNQQLRHIFEGIGRLFHKIGCEKAPILDLLGQVVNSERTISTISRYSEYQWGVDLDHPEVPVSVNIGFKHAVMNVHNVTLYLGVLESRINVVVRTMFFTQGRKKKNQIIVSEPSSHFISEIESISSPCPLCYETAMRSRTDIVTLVMSRRDIKRAIRNHYDIDNRLMHRVSQCDLPQATQTMKKRFQS